VRARFLIAFILLAIGIPLMFPDLLSRLAPAMLYHPEPLGDAEANPAAWGLVAAEEVRFRTSDELALHGWWIPAEATDRSVACGAAVYYHGNAGNLAGRAAIGESMSRLGLDVLLVDYRGYGRSEGRPSEEGLYLDGEAAYRYVREQRGVPPERIALAGNSLGGAVAISVAVRSDAAALVVTSSFRSLPELARTLYPWLPGRLFKWNRNQFHSVGRIGRVEMPVFVGWGRRDELMPRDQTYGLYEAAREPKTWFESASAGHNDLWSEPEFWKTLAVFLERALPC
jgi:fermentation-respiration switch protein FrsA (DUF1100 family)